jgi:hypothetical protein
MKKLTYCSFAVKDKCLGVLILEGSLDPVQAAKVAWTKKLNPGGEVLAMPCTEEDPDIPSKIFEAMWENRDKLLTGDEARKLFEAKSIKEFDEESNLN